MSVAGAENVAWPGELKTQQPVPKRHPLHASRGYGDEEAAEQAAESALQWLEPRLDVACHEVAPVVSYHFAGPQVQCSPDDRQTTTPFQMPAAPESELKRVYNPVNRPYFLITCIAVLRTLVMHRLHEMHETTCLCLSDGICQPLRQLVQLLHLADYGQSRKQPVSTQMRHTQLILILRLLCLLRALFPPSNTLTIETTVHHLQEFK